MSQLQFQLWLLFFRFYNNASSAPPCDLIIRLGLPKERDLIKCIFLICNIFTCNHLKYLCALGADSGTVKQVYSYDEWRHLDHGQWSTCHFFLSFIISHFTPHTHLSISFEKEGTERQVGIFPFLFIVIVIVTLLCIKCTNEGSLLLKRCLFFFLPS